MKIKILNDEKHEGLPATHTTQKAMTPLNKKALSVAVLVYSIPMLAFIVYMWGRSLHILEMIIRSYIFSFLCLAYFLQDIKTKKKALLYCLAIPLFCSVAISMAADIVPAVVQGKLPTAMRSPSDIADLIASILAMWGGVLYVRLGWTFTIPLLLVCGVYSYFSKQAEGSLRDKRETPEIRLMKHKKLTWITLCTCTAFMPLYFFVFQGYWGDYWLYRFNDAVPVCLLSVISFFLLVPAIAGKAKRVFLYCAIFPLFWSFIINALYAASVFAFAWKATRLIEEVLAPSFYLSRYIQSQTWFISLLLLLLYGIYRYLLKQEVRDKQQHTCRSED